MVAKDVRQLSVPVGLWLTFIVASALGIAKASPPDGLATTEEAVAWINYVGGFALLAAVLQQIAGVLLTATLINEDAPADVKAFWPTRPISGLRLLMVKVTVAFLLFAMAPTAVLVPIWFATGFSAAEVSGAAMDYAQGRGVFTLLALPLAALTRNLARFLALVLGIVVLAAFVGVGTEYSTIADVEVQRFPSWIAPALAVAGIGWVLIRQYLGPRRPAWVSLGVALVLAGIGAAPGPWGADPSPLASNILPGPQNAGDRAVKVRVETIRERDLLATLEVTAPADASAIHAPDGGELQLTWPDRPSAAGMLVPGTRWGEVAALQLAGLRRRLSKVPWEMILASHDGERVRSGPPSAALAGRVTMGVWRGRVLWELPVRADAAASAGSSSSRMVAVLPAGERNEKRLIVLHERDAVVPNKGPRVGSWPRNGASRQDVFVLVNRGTDYAAFLPASKIGDAAMNSFGLAIRAFDFGAPTGVDAEAWEANCTVIKVRFERDRSFDRALEMQQVSLERGGESP